MDIDKGEMPMIFLLAMDIDMGEMPMKMNSL